MRPFLSICCLLLAPVLWGQYTPIAIGGEVFFKTELDIQGGPLISEITIIDFDVIEGQVYNRVFIKPGFAPDTLIGHYREDAAGGTAYFRPLEGENILVYDISLELGDSLVLQARWCDGMDHDTARVVAVTEEDGRRLVTFDRQVGGGEICETLTFREGIGPSASLIFPYFVGRSFPEGIAMRICHAARDEQIFYPPNVAIDFCGVPTPAADRADYPSVRAYPTVFRDVFRLEGVAPADECQLWDISGRRVLRWRGAQAPVDLANLRPGAYILQVQGAATSGTILRLVKM